MYIANMNFGNFRKGDKVPDDLPYNNERLTRGLIREVKVVTPIETKSNAIERKPKDKAKQVKQSDDSTTS